MPKYLFSFGNSSTGPIGMCARVKAATKEEALKILQDELNEAAAPEINVSLMDESGPIEYINIYLNPAAIKVEDIDDAEEDPT